MTSARRRNLLGGASAATVLSAANLTNVEIASATADQGTSLMDQPDRRRTRQRRVQIQTDNSLLIRVRTPLGFVGSSFLDGTQKILDHEANPYLFSWSRTSASDSVPLAVPSLGELWDRAHEKRRGLEQLEKDREREQPSLSPTERLTYYVEPNIACEIYFPQRPSDKSAPTPDCDWPKPPTLLWHLEKGYSQLRTAAVAAGSYSVRIAHLDTGYVTHEATPIGLEADLAVDVSGQDRIEGAIDPMIKGPLNNPGHGLDTLTILAGRSVKSINGVSVGYPIGGAPLANIVPVRIASSVVLLWTHALAHGIDYVVELAERGKPVDVISLSMGGIASNLWATAVNKAYERGICIVAAAGNCYDGEPTRNVVYPSRFRRVLTVTGVTSVHRPYESRGCWVMQGNYGPTSVMGDAIAAYTPGVIDAVPGGWGTGAGFGGTSAATPQVAAAAALWIGKYGSRFVRTPTQRVEAVRAALFYSARSSKQYLPQFGNGELRANDTLSSKTLRHVETLQLKDSKADKVSLPLLRLLLGLGEASLVAATAAEEGANPTLEMLEVEARNVLMLSPDTELDLQLDADGNGLHDKEELRRVLQQSGQLSTILRNSLEHGAITE